MKKLLILLFYVFLFSCKKEPEITVKPDFETIIIKDKARLEALNTTTQQTFINFKDSNQNPVIQYSKMKVWYFSNSATEAQLNTIITNSDYTLSFLGSPALQNECLVSSFAVDQNIQAIRKILAFNTKAIIQFYFQNSTSPVNKKYVNIQLQLIPKVVAQQGVLKNTLYQRITVNTPLLTF